MTEAHVTHRSGLAGQLRHEGLGVNVSFNVPATMRDGVTLRSNVYAPAVAGKWPTLLMRTPYGKDVPSEIISCGIDPVQTASRGFLVIIQDTRGRFASDGAWEPFRFEREDGYDSVEWAASIASSNGRVGMYGASYCGNTQWLAAIDAPPSLTAISPQMTWSEPTDGIFARGGALELGTTLQWAVETGIDYIARSSANEATGRRRLDALMDDYDRLGDEAYWDIPVHASPLLHRHGIPELGAIAMLSNPEIADSCRVSGFHDRVTVPTFHVAGWYDVLLQGTLDNYRAMAGLGREARLIVGPWTHVTYSDPVGEQVYGCRAGRDEIRGHPDGDVNTLQLAWLRRHLQLEPAVDVLPMPVRIFVMGTNEWRDESSWPPERAVTERLYLSAEGSLGRIPGSGSAKPSEFTYDPGDPVPTIGGHTIMAPSYPAGPVDQERIERRDDVLVFTSEPLETDLEVTGQVRVILHAQSSAPSTDFVARLCDVYPDGRSVNICDGIIRIVDDADDCRSHEIDLWSTSNVFVRGHRIRIHITSSSFPRWDRNLNTGNQREARHTAARQRVFHDADRTTYVELPVMK